MPQIYTNSVEEGFESPLEDTELDAAVGEGVSASQSEDRWRWAPIEEICNGEWSIGAGN